MGILIKGGRVIDAATDTDKILDVYLDDGVIKKVGEDLEGREGDRVIDGGGLAVMPGLVDLHVHLRDPGQEYKEDIESGSRAAARGGVTTVVAMPNTSPVIDDPDRVRYVHNKAAQVSQIHVLQAGAMTKSEAGKELSDIEGMAKAGVPALSEDGRSVMNASLCREAMRQAARCGLPIFDHCEDMDLRGKGCMNQDENAERLGLPGIPSSTEDTIAARDMVLAMETGARLHLCHCSTKGTVMMMKYARMSGAENITAEVCPHHFILTSQDIQRDDPNYKMNPPLRTREDVQALRQGLKEGFIQVISTDHAPHSQKDKTGSMRTAAFGIVGLETSLALTYTELVETGVLTPVQMVEKMCLNPARILGLDCGTIQEGHPADVIVVDLEHPYTIRKSAFASKGKNTPFDGWEVKGKVLYTICDGKIVYQEAETVC
ncbi:MAG: dihydroorotase [Eubacteriales bacterium]|nr:dihydroorotase [Eubacteriales bacterium]